MSNKPWRIGALAVVAACSAEPQPDPVGVNYDVTETGVAASAADDVDVTAESGWTALRVGELPPLYVSRDSGTIDLTRYHFGRSDIDFPTRPTPVRVALSGLDWQPGDSLQLVTPNVGLSIHELEAHLPYPGAGSTTIGDALDWSRAMSPLIEHGRGDVTWIAQMSSQGTYSVLARAGIARAFTIADGDGGVLDAALQPVAKDRTLTLRWQGSEFAALAAQAGPDAQPAAAPALAIRTLPAALADTTTAFSRYYMYLPSLVDFGPISGSSDVEHAIEYGNPFGTSDATWTDFVTVVYAMPVDVPGAGGTYAMVVQAVPVSALADGVVAPAISPVRNVTVGGANADEPRAGVGVSPTVAWEPPSTGTATAYAVTIRAISAPDAEGGRTITPVATIYTRRTSVTLPASATSSATSYVLAVTAINAAGRDVVATPLRGSLPYAAADHITAPITP